MLCLPQIYRALHDDFAPDPSEWEPTIHPLVGYVALWEDEDLMGIAIVNLHNTVKWEVHNAILPHVGWKKRLKIARSFIEWLWTAGCKRITGQVVASNQYALKFNEVLGMERVGVERKAFMKDGRLQDLVYFGISAPEGIQ